MDSNHSTFVTDTNKTPLIQIITWFLLASAIICTLCRVYTKYAVIRFIGLDDYFVPISLLFLIGQSVAVTIETTNGYGKPRADLTDDHVTTILQAHYIAMLLYPLSLFFSKLPALYLLNLIYPIDHFQTMLFATAFIIFAWAFSSEFVLAFQCSLPHTWDFLNGQCINRMAFLSYFEAMNAFTDALLVLLPLSFISYVRTSLRRKGSVSIVFCTRLLPLGVSIAKIVLNLPTFTSSDPLFTSWPAMVCTQLIQFLSLMSACILYMRPFLEALTSGFINGDDLRRRGQIRPHGLASKDLVGNMIVLSNSSNRNVTSSQSTRRNRWERSLTLRGRWESEAESLSAANSLNSLGVAESRNLGRPREVDGGQTRDRHESSSSDNLVIPHWTLPTGEDRLP